VKKQSSAPLANNPHRRSCAFECVALVLQGGGALGSYQAGVYQALAERDLHPDWVAGISIGAINAAIIAGNAPEERVKMLRGFWESITSNPFLDWVSSSSQLMPWGDVGRGFFNQISANYAMMDGASGFYQPRPMAPCFYPDGSAGATSFYDTEKLQETLERFVDFDRINKDGTRLSVGAVNVKTGNFAYFDNRQQQIEVKHVMASGALPPGFPAIKIGDDYYWDGGMISNTPLQWVVDNESRFDTLAFQVDLWSAVGKVPNNLTDVTTRQKEIQYSSRTRAATDDFQRMQKLRVALSKVLPKIPPELLKTDEGQLLASQVDHKVYNIVHLIYRSRAYEGHSRDYEFSRLTMNEHWQAGYADAVQTLDHKEIFEKPSEQEGVATFDFLK
jgi:NTE family protein